jgi:4-alpha-glucanotransferase
LGRPDNDIVWDFIRLAIASTARYAIFPLQDILNLDTDARMNTPSTLGGNWAWRYRPQALNAWSSGRLRDLVELYGRDVELWRQKKVKSIEVEEA